LDRGLGVSEPGGTTLRLAGEADAGGAAADFERSCAARVVRGVAADRGVDVGLAVDRGVVVVLGDDVALVDVGVSLEGVDLSGAVVDVGVRLVGADVGRDDVLRRDDVTVRGDDVAVRGDDVVRAVVRGEDTLTAELGLRGVFFCVLLGDASREDTFF